MKDRGRCVVLAGALGVFSAGAMAQDSRLAVTPSGSNSLTSYVGLGWGNPLGSGSRWSFSLDLGAFGGGGVFYSTAPEEPGASTSAARESRDSGRLRVLSTWEPVVATGLSYRF